jgi:UDP-N-acetylmuramate dehydrogenase
MTALQIEHGVSLAPFTSLELGGAAEHFAHIRERDQLLEALSWAHKAGKRVTMLAGGSNVIVSDRGVSGLVLRMETAGLEIDSASGLVRAQAGERWDTLVESCVAAGLSGIECLSGIPGSVGAAPIQNIGAYGQELAQTVKAVEVLDVRSLSTHWVTPADCSFSYRHSRWKGNPGAEIVLSLQLQLAPGARPHVHYTELVRALANAEPTPALVRERVLELRRGKSMLQEAASHDPNRRSVGSFFLNPVVSASEAARVGALAPALPQYPQADGTVKLSAAWLIEHAGTCKGERRGAVGVSSKHSLALVHHGGGTTQALLDLAAELRARVQSRFGVAIEIEAVLLGFDA